MTQGPISEGGVKKDLERELGIGPNLVFFYLRSCLINRGNAFGMDPIQFSLLWVGYVWLLAHALREGFFPWFVIVSLSSCNFRFQFQYNHQIPADYLRW